MSGLRYVLYDGQKDSGFLDPAILSHCRLHLCTKTGMKKQGNARSSHPIKCFFLFQQCDILKAFIQKLNYLKEEKLQTFAQCLVANTLSSVPVSPQNTSHEKVVIEMAVHAASVLLCGQNRILGPLRNLAFSPSTMQVRKCMLSFPFSIYLSA